MHYVMHYVNLPQTLRANYLLVLREAYLETERANKEVGLHHTLLHIVNFTVLCTLHCKCITPCITYTVRHIVHRTEQIAVHPALMGFLGTLRACIEDFLEVRLDRRAAPLCTAGCNRV